MVTVSALNHWYTELRDHGAVAAVLGWLYGRHTSRRVLCAQVLYVKYFVYSHEDAMELHDFFLLILLLSPGLLLSVLVMAGMSAGG